MNQSEQASVTRGRAWPFVAPFALFVGLLALEPALADLFAGAFDPRWLYGIRCAATAALLLALWPRYARLPGVRDARRTGAGAWAAAVVVGVAVLAVWVLLDEPPFVLGAGDGFDPRVGGRVAFGFAATRLAGAALVVPLTEELFWRSFLMRWLEDPAFLDVAPSRVGWKALALTSAIFALEHRLWLAGLIAGVAYGELYRRTESLRLTVLAHAVTNGLLGAFVLATGRWEFW